MHCYLLVVVPLSQLFRQNVSSFIDTDTEALIFEFFPKMNLTQKKPGGVSGIGHWVRLQLNNKIEFEGQATLELAN
jgi:hypothetical protein